MYGREIKCPINHKKRRGPTVIDVTKELQDTKVKSIGPFVRDIAVDDSLLQGFHAEMRVAAGVDSFPALCHRVG